MKYQAEKKKKLHSLQCLQIRRQVVRYLTSNVIVAQITGSKNRLLINRQTIYSYNLQEIEYNWHKKKQTEVFC